VLRAEHWEGYVALIALLLTIAQALIEGPRWQMVPAYALAGLFFLIWLLQNIAPGGGIAGHRWMLPGRRSSRPIPMTGVS
jgi:hypothetical protein